MRKIKELFKSMESRRGSYSMGIVTMVIGIAIVLNLIVGQLPENMRSIDISDVKIYEISDTSKKIVKELQHNITIYMMADKSNVDERISTFVKKYAAMSDNITLEWIDPVLHPSALTTYNTEADSLVVSCEETGKMMPVPFSEIIVYDESTYYTTGSVTESEFDGEGQITSAIKGVTSDTTKTIYRMAGHGEASLSNTISDLFEKSNFTTAELNLLINQTIPQDCDLILMNGPTTDLAETEITALKTYMEQGGKLMVLLSGEEKELKNLQAFLKEYGLEKVTGNIADTTSSYQGNPYYIFPQMSLSGEMADGISSEMLLLVQTLGFQKVDPVREEITVTPFMTTTDNGLAVTEENQTQGNYVLGAVATENDSRMTVIGTNAMIDAQVTEAFPTLENVTVFMNAVTANFDDVENISIKAKSLLTEYNTVKYAGAFSMLVIFGIPLIFIIIGCVVWWKRRKA